MDCKHLDSGTGWKCPAFPAGIPLPILNNTLDHREPLPGQMNEIVFSKKKLKVNKTIIS